MWVYPLSHGVPARVRISVAGRGLNIDGKRRLKLDVDGGTAGLIIDARGRPLPLATNLKALSVQIPEWYAQVTGDPIYERADRMAGAAGGRAGHRLGHGQALGAER